MLAKAQGCRLDGRSRLTGLSSFVSGPDKPSATPRRPGDGREETSVRSVGNSRLSIRRASASTAWW